MTEDISLNDYRNLNYEISAMIKSRELLKTQNELLIAASKLLLEKIQGQGPISGFVPAVKALQEAIEISEKCTGKS